MAMVFPPMPGLPLPYRLRGVGFDHLQEPIDRAHGYPQHQWIQVRRGRLAVEVAGTRAVARAGDGLWLGPDEAHRYRSVGEEPAVVHWIGFDGPGVEAALLGGPLTASGVYRLDQPTVLDEFWTTVWAEAGEAAPRPARLSARVYELLMALTEAVAATGQTSAAAGRGRLEPVLAALAARPAHPWDVEVLAALLGVTPQHLGRLFRRTVGQSPLDYLARLRVRRAQALLADRPDLRVHEVGEAVGYPDPNYFTRVFRRLEGHTPGEFRRLHGLW